MKRQPRDYQLACFAAIRSAFKARKKRIVVELCTGAGKTVIFVLMAAMVKENKGKVLIIVNRDVLVQQALDELAENGVHAQREQSNERASLTAEVVVGSVQSMQKDWLKKWPKDHFKLVVCDECHGSAAATFRSILDHFGDTFHVGVTATAERHDKKSLWKGYEDIVYRMPLKDWHDKKTGELTRGGIDQGWLCDFDFHDLDCPVTLDEKLMKQATWKDGEEVFDSAKYLPRLAGEMAVHLNARKGLVFATNCRVSNSIAALLVGHGINARHVDSSYMTADQTSEILAWFKYQKCATLVNASLLTTGYNQKDIDTVVMARPVASTTLFKQMLGRGTRAIADVDAYPTPELRKLAIAQSDKPVCRIVNIFWENGSHDLASPSCLITDDKEEQAALNKASKPGAQFDLAQLEKQLKAKRMADIEEEARKFAEQAARSQQKKLKPGDVYIADILKWSPLGDGATEKQLSFAKRLGAPIIGLGLTKKQASAVISRFMKAKGIPTT